MLDQYDYSYNPESIAQAPAKPRDSARLMVYDRTTGLVTSDTFKNLGDYLPAKSVIVLNRTKVVPARLWAHKPTGGRVQIFYLSHGDGLVRALSPVHLAKDSMLFIAPKVAFRVIGKEGNEYKLKPSFPLARLDTILERYGTTPIPPYIKDSPLSEKQLRQEYQAVFAHVRGSVAAPTASLHFTERLLTKLRKGGHDICYVTLHVGLGTFAPLTDEQLKSGRLHSEEYRIDVATAKRLNAAKSAGRPIIAVGTTVARTLESAADARGKLKKLTGKTNLFVREGYNWKFVNALITNFHVPRSSLMMLVASFIGSPAKLLDLYRRAIDSGFKLFSFGDGMLIR